MGTRHLTCIRHEGQWALAQYGQWDGYPDGQGARVLRYLRDWPGFEMRLRRALRVGVVREPTPEERTRMWVEAGVLEYEYNKTVSVPYEAATRMGLANPGMSRDTGAEILELVARLAEMPTGSELLVSRPDASFGGDSLMCEWAWVVDLDRRELLGFRGFRTEPVDARDPRELFADQPLADRSDRGLPPGAAYDGTIYHQVGLAAWWSLDALPTDEDFLAAFREDEDTDTEETEQ